MMSIISSKSSWMLLISMLVAINKPIEKKKITLFMAGDSTMAIKETKAYPETGWGMPFQYFFDSSVTIVNKAKNGRSTKTFISEGLWSSIINNVTAGDYVMIQFGHNDESKEKVDRYTTPDEYKTNILRFINETKAKNATPILLTPVSRRKFDKQGNAMDTHEIYSAIVRSIAKETNVLFIDADEQTKALYQSFGEKNSTLLFLQLQPGEHPNYPEGKNDNTHFNELGARLVAQLILKALQSSCPDIASRIIVPAPKK